MDSCPKRDFFGGSASGFGQAAAAVDAGQHARAVDANWLQIGLKRALSGDVRVRTQKLGGVAHHFALAANCALSCHTVLTLYTKAHVVSSLGSAIGWLADGSFDFGIGDCGDFA